MYRSSLAGLGLSSLLFACTSFSDAEVTPSGGAGGSTTGGAGSAGSSPSGGQGGQAGKASGGAGSAGAAGNHAGSGGAGSGGQGGQSGASASGSSGQSGSNPGGSAQGGLGGSSGGTASGGAPSGGQAGQGGEAGLAQGGSPAAGSTGASGAGQGGSLMGQAGSMPGGGAGQAGSAGQGGDPCSSDKGRCVGALYQICASGQWTTVKQCETSALCTEQGCKAQSVCGNGVLESGEACDGLLATPSCAEVMPGTLGQTSCTMSCQLDISACQSCGNGKTDPGEFCDSQDLAGLTCQNLTGSVGTLSCSQCRVDTSSCSLPVCGYRGGLMAASAWPALGGCMRRPRTVPLAGPASNQPTVKLLVSLTPQVNGVDPSFGLNNNYVWHYQNRKPARYNIATSSLTVGTFSLPATSWIGQVTMGDETTPVARSMVLTDNFLLVDALSSVPMVVEVPQLPKGDLLVTSDSQGAVYYHYPSAKGIHRGQGAQGFSALWPSPFPLGGTMAYDDTHDWIVAAQSDCSECTVVAYQQGMIAWQTKVTGGALNHVAIGSDGAVYVSGSNTLAMFNPLQPDKVRTFDYLGKARPVALLPDATARFALSRGTPDVASSLVSLSPSLQSQWFVQIQGDLLNAPVVDVSGTTYLCTGEHVYAIDALGIQRWVVPVPPSSTCTLVSRSGQLVVVLDSGMYTVQ